MDIDAFMEGVNPMAAIAILNKNITAVGLAQGMKEHLNTVEIKYEGQTISMVNQYCQFKDDIVTHMNALRNLRGVIKPSCIYMADANAKAEEWRS